MQFGLMSLSDHIRDPNTGEYELDQAGRHRSSPPEGCGVRLVAARENRGGGSQQASGSERTSGGVDDRDRDGSLQDRTDREGL